ncbi:hypothetical protein [Streptosporangium sp. NPDC000396]|uniref:hypothetical protein n=1 Tax=Streptosporangium sp. NPDC000396 TaxID=3366185 RepID=UPI00368ADA50
MYGTPDVQFNAPVSSITFSAPDATAPLPGAYPALAAIVRDHAVHTVANARLILGWLDKMHAEIAASFADGPPALDRAAKRMAMSSRTFQCRLHEEGTSWREEVEKVREAEATRLLRDTGLTSTRSPPASATSTCERCAAPSTAGTAAPPPAGPYR